MTVRTLDTLTYPIWLEGRRTAVIRFEPDGNGWQVYADEIPVGVVAGDTFTDRNVNGVRAVRQHLGLRTW